MIQRALVLCLAFIAQGMVLTTIPAAAQGLRLTPPAGNRTAPRSAQANPQRADYIVAVVNSEPVTNNEVRVRAARLEQQLAQQGQAVPSGPEFARQVLERLIS